MKRLAFIFVFLLAASYNSLTACSCMPPQPVPEEVAKSGYVFSGKILSIASQNDFQVTYKVLVVTNYKGTVNKRTVLVKTGRTGADCGFNFVKGKKYLIYGSSIEDDESAPGTISTSICTRTKLYLKKEAAQIQKAVRDSEK